MRERAKKILPWGVSLVMCGVLLWPFHDAAGRAALGTALGHASSWTLVVIAAFAILIWLTDAWATGMTFRQFGTDISIRDACFVRGATLVFDAVNPSLGQIALGVVMYRRGTPLARTVQTMLLLNIIFMLQIVCAAGLGLVVGRNESSGLSATAVLVSLAFAGAYLLVVAVKPGFLAKRSSFAHLFEVGLKGHARAFAVRLPSMTCMFLGVYATMFCFGIHVPAWAILVYVPAIVLITGVPVSVQGLGPAQLAQIAFFARYIDTPDPRAAEASVLAWGLTSSVGMAAASFLVGVACLFTREGSAAFVAGRKGKSAAELEAARHADAAPGDDERGGRVRKGVTNSTSERSERGVTNSTSERSERGVTNSGDS